MIQKIYRIEEIAPHIQHNSLVALDLDNTLIHSATYYGSVEWEEALIDQFVDQGLPLKEAFSRAEKLWTYAQRKIQVQSIEKESAQLIQKAAAVCDIIGLTARGIDLREITHQGLRFNNITFSSYDNAMDILHQGVLYCSGSSVKGRVLIRFIDEILQERKNTLNTIVVVDDKQENLELIEASPLREKFSLHCFHYLYAARHTSLVPGLV